MLDTREWRMESGEWRMENGEWRVESGEWRVENGEWRMGNVNRGMKCTGVSVGGGMMGMWRKSIGVGNV
jgi:hypothetical protein